MRCHRWVEEHNGSQPGPFFPQVRFKHISPKPINLIIGRFSAYSYRWKTLLQKNSFQSRATGSPLENTGKRDLAWFGRILFSVIAGFVLLSGKVAQNYV